MVVVPVKVFSALSVTDGIERDSPAVSDTVSWPGLAAESVTSRAEDTVPACAAACPATRARQNPEARS
jgi:hypothetical protein